MLYNPNHMICQQSLHLRFFGDVATVQQFSHELSSWTATVLMPALESLLESFPMKGRLRIPKFELDAGSIYGEDWQQQLTQRICQQLKAELTACVTPEMLAEQSENQQGSSIRDWARQIAGQKEAGTVVFSGDASAASEQLPGSAVDATMANASRQATPGRVPAAVPAGNDLPYNINDYTLNNPVMDNDGMVTGGKAPGYNITDGRKQHFTNYSADDQMTSADGDFIATGTGYQQRFATYAPEVAREGSVIAASQELILHYLRHGSVPWHATGLPGSLLRSWLHEYVNAGGMFTDAGRALFTQYPVALQRLLLQCAPDVVLSSYIKFFTPAVDYYYCFNRVLQPVLEAEQGSRLALAIVYEMLLTGDSIKPLWKQWLSRQRDASLLQPIQDIIPVLRTAGSVSDEQLEHWTMQIHQLATTRVSTAITRSVSGPANAATGFQWVIQSEHAGSVNAASGLSGNTDGAASGEASLSPFSTNESNTASSNYASPAAKPVDSFSVLQTTGIGYTEIGADNSPAKPTKDIIAAEGPANNILKDVISSAEAPAGNLQIDEINPSIKSGLEHPAGDSKINEITPSIKSGVEHPADNLRIIEINPFIKAGVGIPEGDLHTHEINPSSKAAVDPESNRSIRPSATGTVRTVAGMPADGTTLQTGAERTTSNKPLLTLGLLPDEPVADAALYISTAGLVIVHAVIVPWLTELGLLINEEWRDAAAQDRAVMLLYYLCTGKCEAADYELALCKLLTGFPLNEPATGSITPTPQETEECMQVLQQVIDQWPVMKNSSVESLRETFLYRDGKLQVKGGKWLLQVASSPFDMLLQHIPWGFSVVRNSKMNALLFVEWA
ncbi:hypothetical protein SAMN05444266_103201 [Chitinophaga jiangningensis]|uniref:Uncharacterized protein n=1 Tax=Chitinophaga jiangningensis TaxID=1419482 RepID=A0A1M7AB81_9BACT|nr:contractile injection system tape measure protein [Chitinophaga jiangningensis]SHL39799.1 hypothetical protein SAMN05444266_103201 [Chitinophaga jiangningensis]